MNYFCPGLVNTNWGPGPVNTDLVPRPINTNLVPGPVNTNSGPGLRAGKYKYPIFLHKLLKKILLIDVLVQKMNQTQS